MNLSKFVVGEEYFIQPKKEFSSGAYRYDSSINDWGNIPEDQYPKSCLYLGPVPHRPSLAYFENCTVGQSPYILRCVLDVLNEKAPEPPTPRYELKVWDEDEEEWNTQEVKITDNANKEAADGDWVSISVGAISKKQLQAVADRYFRLLRAGYKVSAESEADLDVGIDIGCVNIEGDSLKQLCIDLELDMDEISIDA